MTRLINPRQHLIRFMWSNPYLIRGGCSRVHLGVVKVILWDGLLFFIGIYSVGFGGYGRVRLWGFGLTNCPNQLWVQGDKGGGPK